MAALGTSTRAPSRPAPLKDSAHLLRSIRPHYTKSVYGVGRAGLCIRVENKADACVFDFKFGVFTPNSRRCNTAVTTGK